MKTITKDNISELQILFDTLVDTIKEWGEITIPKLLTVNQTGSKWTTEKDTQTYVTVSQTHNPEPLKEETTIYLNFFITPPKEEKVSSREVEEDNTIDDFDI